MSSILHRVMGLEVDPCGVGRVNTIMEGLSLGMSFAMYGHLKFVNWMIATWARVYHYCQGWLYKEQSNTVCYHEKSLHGYCFRQNERGIR